MKENSDLKGISPELDEGEDFSKDFNIDDMPVESISDSPDEDDWNGFINNLERKGGQKKVFCQVECELAYTLDECRVNGASRSEMVNAIVRGFLEKHISRFAEYKQTKKTLF